MPAISEECTLLGFIIFCLVLFHIFFYYLIFFFCNTCNSFLSFGGPQQYNSETLPFTYDQYVVMELADKLYNSVTVCFCVSPWIFIQINNFSKLPGIEPVTLGLQSQRSTSTPWRTHLIDLLIKKVFSYRESLQNWVPRSVYDCPLGWRRKLEQELCSEGYMTECVESLCGITVQDEMYIWLRAT